MRIKEAQKALEDRKAVLADLTGRSVSLGRDLEALRGERKAAVRDLAAGDETKREIMHDLDTKIESLALRLEGTEDSIAEAKTGVENATADLVKAADEEQAALNAFVAARQFAEQEALVAAIPERLNHICDLFMALSKALGQVQIDFHRFGKYQGENKLRDLLLGFNYRFNQLLAHREDACRIFPSLLSLQVPGWAAPVGRFHGIFGFPIEDVIKEIREQNLARLTEAFYKDRDDHKEGGE